MRRSEIWTGADAAAYAQKPRPVVIVQDDVIDATDSITVCAITTTFTEAPLIRIPVLPSPGNGLRAPSWIMVDKILTLPRVKLGLRIGYLGERDQNALNQAIIIFLGLVFSTNRADRL